MSFKTNTSNTTVMSSLTGGCCYFCHPRSIDLAHSKHWKRRGCHNKISGSSTASPSQTGLFLYVRPQGRYTSNRIPYVCASRLQKVEKFSIYMECRGSSAVRTQKISSCINDSYSSNRCVIWKRSNLSVLETVQIRARCLIKKQETNVGAVLKANVAMCLLSWIRITRTCR